MPSSFPPVYSRHMLALIAAERTRSEKPWTESKFGSTRPESGFDAAQQKTSLELPSLRAVVADNPLCAARVAAGVAAAELSGQLRAERSRTRSRAQAYADDAQLGIANTDSVQGIFPLRLAEVEQRGNAEANNTSEVLA